MATPSVPAGYKLVPDDGANQTVVPEARGKAAARDRWLAQGKGNPDRMAKGAKFRHGPMKGLTYDQANQKFESMWTNAPETLKEGYAQHARSGATPSEVAAAANGGDSIIPGITPARVTNASLNATKPGETMAQVYARQRASRSGGKTETTPTTPAYKPAPGNSFAELTTLPPIPAGGVNSIGNGEFANGKAMTPMQRAAAERDRQKQEAASPTGRTSLYSDVKNGPAGKVESPTSKTPGRAASNSFIPNSGTGGFGGAMQDFPNEAAKGVNKFKADEAARQAEVADAAAAAAQRQRDASKVDAERAAAGLPAVNRAAAPAAIPALTTPPQPPAGQPAQAVGSTSPPPQIMGLTSVQGPPRSAMNQPYAGPMRVAGAAPTGAPVMDRPAPINGQPTDPAIKSDGAGLTRVNRLTGLPFGFRPGDALPKSADAAMQQRGNDSAMRQSINQSRAIPSVQPTPVSGAMPRGPASQPERAFSVIAPTPPPKANDPDIIRKDNVAAANYQSSFSGGNPSDAEFNAAKNGQKALYDNASSMDQTRLVVNTLKRNAALDDTRKAPRARVVTPQPVIQGMKPTPPMRQPLFRR